MAKEKQAEKLEPPGVEAFILRDCGFGNAGDVVMLSVSDAEDGEQHGMLDLHPAAITSAKEQK